MRAAIIALLIVPALAGCGDGSSFDTGFKKSYREKGIKSCVEQARKQSPMGAASMDVEGLCTCTIDKVMEGKSATELMNPPEDKVWQDIAEQCLAQSRRAA
jgi:hypothetical protein